MFYLQIQHRELHLMPCVCSVTQLCLTLCGPMDCSPPGSSVHGILQVRILEWVAIPFSRGSSHPRDPTHVSCITCMGRWILYHQCPLGSLRVVLNPFYFPLPSLLSLPFLPPFASKAICICEQLLISNTVLRVQLKADVLSQLPGFLPCALSGTSPSSLSFPGSALSTS